jgi:hypothetical protein
MTFKGRHCISSHDTSSPWQQRQKGELYTPRADWIVTLVFSLFNHVPGNALSTSTLTR